MARACGGPIGQSQHCLLLLALLAAASLPAALASTCNSGVLQLRRGPPLDWRCFPGAYLNTNTIKPACLLAVRVTVAAGAVKIEPLDTSTYNYSAFGPSSGPLHFNCQDMSASGLLYPGSSTRASIKLYDDVDGKLSNLTKTGVHQLTLTPAQSYSYKEPAPNCQYNYTVVQGCVLGVRGPAKPEEACPASYYRKQGRFGISYCAPCAAGTYASKVGGACTPCPPGTYAPTVGATRCTRCEPGTYSSKPGALYCQYCPLYDGKWTDGVACRSCPKGSFGSEANGAQCVKCYAGKKCCTVGWSTDCPKCADAAPSATYTSLFALESTTPTSCLATRHALCAPKISVTIDGSCSITLDNRQYDNNPDDETFCPWGVTLPLRGSQFSIADLAKFDTLPTNSSLTDGNFTGASSPYLTVSIPSTNCTLRYRALTSPAATLLGAAPKPGKATTCPAGQYLESNTDAKPGPCLPCPPGTYSPRASSGRNCFRCMAGTYAPGYGSKKCKGCPAWQSSEPGKARCST